MIQCQTLDPILAQKKKKCFDMLGSSRYRYAEELARTEWTASGTTCQQQPAMEYAAGLYTFNSLDPQLARRLVSTLEAMKRYPGFKEFAFKFNLYRYNGDFLRKEIRRSDLKNFGIKHHHRSFTRTQNAALRRTDVVGL